MKLLVIILATLIYRNWVGGSPLSGKFSFNTWISWVDRKEFVSSQPRWVSLAICVAVPLVLLVSIGAIFSDWLVLLVFHSVALLLLVYAMADFALRDQLDNFLDRLAEESAASSPEALIEEKEQQKESLIYRTFETYFVTVGWYLILGPVGLLFYILIKAFNAMEKEKEQEQEQEQEQDSETRALIDRIVYFLDWVPSRMTSLLFSFTGNFVDAFAEWLEALFKWDEDIKTTLVRSADSALSVKQPSLEDKDSLEADIEMELSELDLLLTRTVWAWVGLVALITILGF